jgi:hypothetical protein
VLNSIDGYVRNLTIKVNAGAEINNDTSTADQTSLRRISPSPNLDPASDLARQTGDFSIYKYYLGFAGYWTFFLALVILAIYSFCLVFPSKMFFP